MCHLWIRDTSQCRSPLDFSKSNTSGKHFIWPCNAWSNSCVPIIATEWLEKTGVGWATPNWNTNGSLNATPEFQQSFKPSRYSGKISNSEISQRKLQQNHRPSWDFRKKDWSNHLDLVHYLLGKNKLRPTLPAPQWTNFPFPRLLPSIRSPIPILLLIKP
jgi:hypothetical protein